MAQAWTHAGQLRSAAVTALTALLVVAAGCASDVAADAGPTGPREAMLAIGEGLVLSTGEVQTGASYLKVDLILYKNQGGFDLKPGSESASAQMAMKVFGGGVPTIFKSLDEVPSTRPGNADIYGYMSDVGTGWGATVQHNIGDGYSKIWIKQAVAAAGKIVVQWEALPN